MQDISPIIATWDTAAKGWDLRQIGQTLIVVPDLNHWLKNKPHDFDTLRANFDYMKFEQQLEAKGVTDIIFKATDATTITGELYRDTTAHFWHWLGGQFGLRRGAYHWLQYSVDPTVAWNYYRAFLDDYPCEWPHICDFEETSVTNATDYLWRAKVWYNLANADMVDKNAICYTGLWYIDKLKGLLASEGKSWSQEMGWLHEQPLWAAVYSSFWPVTFAEKYMSYRVYDNKPLWPWTEEEMIGWQHTGRAHYPYEGYSTGESGRNWGFDGDGLDLNFFQSDFLATMGETPDPIVDPPEPEPEPEPTPEPETTDRDAEIAGLANDIMTLRIIGL